MNFFNLFKIRSYTQALILNPKDDATLYNKGVVFDDLRKY